MRVSHLSKKDIVHCPFCDCPYKDLGSLKAHVWTHRSPEEVAAALAAGEKMPKPKSRREKNVMCQECGKTYKSGKELR